MRIKIIKDGPYRITGGLPLDEQIIVTDEAGHPLELIDKKEYPLPETYILCRCGASKNKPFCDGIHREIDFDGSETASRKPYIEKAEIFEGPELKLTDAHEFCEHSRFCLRSGGIRNLIQKSDDPEAQQTAIEEAMICPSGRLVLSSKRAWHQRAYWETGSN
jgi:CDGSH-type Zn-finger protein